MINAIKYMDELEQTGFTKEQAKASVNFWIEIMNENLATKNDLKEIAHQVEKLNLEFRHETQSIRSEIQNMRSEINSEMKLMSSSLTIKLGSLLTAGIGILVFLLKF